MSPKKLPLFVVLTALLGGCSAAAQQSSSGFTAPPVIPQHSQPLEHQGWHPLMEKPEEGKAYIRVYQDTSKVGEISLTSRDMPLIRAIREVYPDAPIKPSPGIDLSMPIDVWVDKVTPSQYLDYLGSRIGGRIEITAEGAISIHSDTSATVDFGGSNLGRSDWSQLVEQAQSLGDRHDDLWVLIDHQNKVILVSGSGRRVESVRAALEQFRTYHTTRNVTR